MFLVGLTGGIASGKSTACKEFSKLGCPVIDADLIARDVVEPGQPATLKIRATFGDEVFHKDGTLNREKLGQIIFYDEAKRKQLNSIVHPAIKKRMLWQVCLYALKGHQFAILDVPLLFETKQMLPFVSFTIVVYCSKDQQLTRLMHRNNLSEEDANARITSQLPLDEKCELCTFVIDNTGNLESVTSNVYNIFLQLKSSRRHLILRFGLLSSVFGIATGLYLLLLSFFR